MFSSGTTSSASVPVGRSPGLVSGLRLQSPKFWQILVVGAAIAVGGCVWLANIPTADRREQLPVSSIYAGRKVASSWVSIRGRLVWSAAAFDGTKYAGTYYVPMVADRWTADEPVMLLVVVSSRNSENWTNYENVEGIVSSALPSHVTEFFASNGPPLSQNVLILDANARPGQGQRLAHITIAFGVVLTILAFCFFEAAPATPRVHNPGVGRMLTLGPRAADLAELNGDIAPDDPQIVQREEEVQRWMRDHGLSVVDSTADEIVEEVCER